MMPKRAAAAGPLAALALIACLWGYNWPVMKESLLYAGPFDFNALRMAFGCVVLFLFMVFRREPLAPPFPLWTAALGFIQTSLGTGLILWALETGGAGKTSILVYTMPFWILLLARLILGERLRASLWVPVVMAFCGLVFILEPWHLGGTTQSKVLAVLSGICWAAGAILVKLLGRDRKLDLLRVTAWQLLFGTLPLAAAALLIPSKPIVWSPYFIGSMVYNSILVCGFAFALWTYVLDRLPAGIAGLGSLAVPVIGMTASRLQLGEDIGFWEGWGIALIVLALLLLSAIRLRETRKETAIPGED